MLNKVAFLELVNKMANAASQSGNRIEFFRLKNVVKRFLKLTKYQKQLALEGIGRHINACIACEITPTTDAFFEIITDAKSNRQIWKESDMEFWKKEIV